MRRVLFFTLLLSGLMYAHDEKREEQSLLQPSAQLVSDAVYAVCLQYSSVYTLVYFYNPRDAFIIASINHFPQHSNWLNAEYDRRNTGRE